MRKYQELEELNFKFPKNMKNKGFSHSAQSIVILNWLVL